MPPDGITIRRATLDDAEGILHAHHAAVYGKAASHYTPEQIEGWVKKKENFDQRIKQEAKNLADPGLLVYVAEYQDSVIGFSMIVPAKNELRAVYVMPGNWKDVGGRLLKKIEEEALQLNLPCLECDSSINAEAFYSKHGYEVVERTMHHLQTGGEILCMKMIKRF